MHESESKSFIFDRDSRFIVWRFVLYLNKISCCYQWQFKHFMFSRKQNTNKDSRMADWNEIESVFHPTICFILFFFSSFFWREGKLSPFVSIFYVDYAKGKTFQCLLWCRRDKNKILTSSQMRRQLIAVFGIILIACHLTLSLKCYLSGYPWPKDCSFLIHERHGTNPACLSAVIYDGNF